MAKPKTKKLPIAELKTALDHAQAELLKREEDYKQLQQAEQIAHEKYLEALDLKKSADEELGPAGSGWERARDARISMSRTVGHARNQVMFAKQEYEKRAPEISPGKPKTDEATGRYVQYRTVAEVMAEMDGKHGLEGDHWE